MPVEILQYLKKMCNKLNIHLTIHTKAHRVPVHVLHFDRAVSLKPVNKWFSNVSHHAPTSLGEMLPASVQNANVISVFRREN